MLQISKILKGIDKRIIFLLILSCAVVFILLLRLWQLQLSGDATYRDKLRGQSLRIIRQPAVRGRIESSDGDFSDNCFVFLPEFKPEQFS